MSDLVHSQPALDQTKVLQIVYTHYRGETATRHIVPQRLWFGSTSWHPDPQWLLDAVDVGKDVERSFALKDIRFTD